MGISKSYLKDKFLSKGGNTKNNFSVKKSTITGANKGLFSNNPIPQGGFIGLAHENNQPVGTLGRMHNHSENPNMRSVKVGNQRYVYATRDIQPGEELTTNYRFQPELEQPEDFMGAKRFAQKGTYQMGGTILAEPDYDIYKAPKQGNYLLPDINRPYYTDEEGRKRSEYKMGFNIDGKETLLPSVVGGRQLSPEETINRYRQTGLHMGQYNTPEEAEYASRLRTAKYNMLQDPARFNASMFQMGGTMSVPGVNGQVVSSGPQPLTSVKKTRGPITKTKKGNVKTMPTKAVKKILKNLK
jgi:hypothetical protein